MVAACLGVMKTARVDARWNSRLDAVLGRMDESTEGIRFQERTALIASEILNLDGGRATGDRDFSNGTGGVRRHGPIGVTSPSSRAGR